MKCASCPTELGEPKDKKFAQIEFVFSGEHSNRIHHMGMVFICLACYERFKRDMESGPIKALIHFGSTQELLDGTSHAYELIGERKKEPWHSVSRKQRSDSAGGSFRLEGDTP